MIPTCLDDCTYQVSSLCKVFNLLAGANMSENTPKNLWGMYTLLWVAMETTFHSPEKWKNLTKDAWDNFDNTGKKSFSYRKERSRKSKKIVKGGVHPPMNPSPIKGKKYHCLIFYPSNCKSIQMILDPMLCDGVLINGPCLPVFSFYLFISRHLLIIVTEFTQRGPL